VPGTTPPRKSGRRAPWKLPVILVLVAASSALAVVQAARVARSARVMPLRSVAVVGADGDLAEEVRAYAGLALETPLLSIDLESVAAQVGEHPFIARAEVRRVPPDTVEIAVHPRTPALVIAAGASYLVDTDGTVFSRARAGAGLDLPVLTGVSPESVADGSAQGAIGRALDLLKASGALALSEVHVGPTGDLDVVLADDTRVYLGADGFAAKLARLEQVSRELAQRGQQAWSIHFDDDRRPERAAVRLRSQAEMRAAGGKENSPRERGGAASRERQPQEDSNGTKEGSAT
jgi:cell division protein FtsQ